MKKSVPSIHKVGLNYGFGNFTSLPLHIPGLTDTRPIVSHLATSAVVTAQFLPE